MKSLLILIVLFSTLSVTVYSLEQPLNQNQTTDSGRPTNTWTGNTNTDWATSTNWSQSHVPQAAEDVVVPSILANRYPHVNGSRVCNSLTVNSSSNIYIENGTLTIGSTFSNNGNLRFTVAGAVLVVGTILQFYTGSRISVTAGLSPEIRVGGDLYFYAGSNTQMGGGRIKMTGTGTHYIETNNATILNVLTIACTSCTFLSASNGDLTISDSLNVLSGSTLIVDAPVTTHLKGNVTAIQMSSYIKCNAGTVSLEGGSNTIVTLPYNSWFNNLIVAKDTGFHASLNDILLIKGDLTINSGALWATGQDISIYGNWTDNVANGFDGGENVVFNGTGNQNIFGDEYFFYLDVNKASGVLIIEATAAVSCERYHWFAGDLNVWGSLTANSLYDNTLAGNLAVFGTCEFHAGTSYYVNVSGTLQILGGTFSFIGGANPAFFNSGGILNISSGGVCDFQTIGITIGSTFNLIAADGTLRTVGGVSIQNSAFSPSGLTIEMYGSSNSVLSAFTGAQLYNLTIAKNPGYQVLLGSDITVNGTVHVSSGGFCGTSYSTTYDIFLYGNWLNDSGGSNDSDLKVFLNGGNFQYFYGTQNFAVIFLNKSSQGLTIADGAVISCDVYRGYNGWLAVYGLFTANSLNASDAFEERVVVTGTAIFHAGSTPVNVSGQLEIYNGGTLTVTGGANPVTFLSGGSLYLDSGVLEYTTANLTINSGFTFNTTNGTLRVGGNVNITNNSLSLTGLTIELYGNGSSDLTTVSGAQLYNLIISKGDAYWVTAHSTISINGYFYLMSGKFSTNGNTVTITGGTYVYGYLFVNSSSYLRVSSLNVYSGGNIEVYGTASHYATVTHAPGTAAYAFNVLSGASITAYYGWFEFMNAAGINVQNGAYVHYMYSFHHCCFTSGVSGGTLLTINSIYDTYIYAAVFPANNWGGASNVSKTVNQGHVYFISATGAYSGESYDNDTYNRIEWTTTPPPVPNLTITYNAVSDQIHLDWDYYIPEATYNVYKCAVSPYGTYQVYYPGITTTYADLPVGAKCFYKVTAVLP
jgi:hypothetical protein